MGATTKPAFHAMSVDELEHSRTALEIKISSVDASDKSWILARFDDLMERLKAEETLALTIDRPVLISKLDAVDYETRDWVLALFDEVVERVEDRATDSS